MKKVLILAGLSWDTTVQRHHAVARRMESLGYEVYFAEAIVGSAFSIKKLIERFYNKFLSRKKSNINVPRGTINVVKTGFVNPQGGLFKIVNSFKLKSFYRNIPNEFDVVINYLPVKTTEAIINHINFDFLVYDCVRDFENWGGYPKGISVIESKMVQNSNAVLVDSYYLRDKLRKKYPTKKIIQMLPMLKEGQADVFLVGKPPKAIRKVTYIGHIGPHIDLSVLGLLIESGYEVHHFGSSSLKVNLDIKSHGFISSPEELARKILQHTDAIIIPYKGNMDGVIPAKLFECLATRLPVYISDFHDSRVLEDMLYVYKTKDDLIESLRQFKLQSHEVKLKQIDQFILDHGSANEIKNLDVAVGEIDKI